MALLDRLLPAWRHRDPEVRLAAVRDLGADAADTLASLARSDTDARVRRLALKKIDDPDVLADLSRTESDEALRDLAITRADELRVERAISHRPGNECVAAVAALHKASSLATVAIRAHHAAARHAALARVDDQPSLADIARRSDDPDIGTAALARLSDHTLLPRIAARGARPEVALAALARIDDPHALLAIAEDLHAPKNVGKRARAMLDTLLTDDHPIRVAERQARLEQLCVRLEQVGDTFDPIAARAALHDAEHAWREVSARSAVDAALSARFQRACETVSDALARAERRTALEQKHAAERHQAYTARQQLCETVETLEGAETPAGLDAARRAWEALPASDDPRCHELAARFTFAVERCEERYRRWQVREAFRSQLERLVHEAELLAGAGDPHAATRPWARLEKRWKQLAASPDGAKWLPGERALQRRFVAAGETLHTQRDTLHSRREQQEREATSHLTTLCARLEQLVQAETFKRAAAERALTAAAAALHQFPPVPAAERAALRQRLEAAERALTDRLDTQAAAEGWKQWANAEVQQQLIDRAEALLAAGDPRAMLQALAQLDGEWAAAAVAPRDQSQQLWERFRSARDALRQHCRAYLAENLAKKEALCAAVEQLADSTEWNATAAAIRQLQAEWKQIGAVPRRHSAALFERFRAPADRFFERRQQALAARKERREELLGRMRGLCDAAEALADSAEWESAAAELKKLQAEARNVWKPRRSPARPAGDQPPLPEALQQRFHDACNRFFDRYRRRDELARDATLGTAETILADLETLRAAYAEGGTADDVVQRFPDALAAWNGLGALPAARAAELRRRLQERCDAIEAALPGGLPDAAVAAAANVPQREKLCSRLERLLSSLPDGAAPEPTDLATRLKLALAANTIGGSAATRHEQTLREAAETAERLRDKWDRLGPVVGSQARALAQRFDQAAAAVAARCGRPQPSPDTPHA